MRSITPVVACVAAFLTFRAPAWATTSFTITPTFDSTITGDANAAAIEGVINNAISIYQSTFIDPINVNITFQEMSSGLGMSNTFFGTTSYTNFLTHLTADAKSTDDATAMASLPTAAQYLAFYNTTNINVKTANLRAVGIASPPTPGGQDGTISLNTSLTSPGSPGTSNTYSLLVVVEHEIDEVLGLGSALSSLTTPFPEDLYRYTSTPGLRSFTSSGSARAFFSINGGVTDLVEFDNQADGGDYGDWRSSATVRVQDAFATPGATPALAEELRALDVIGYDVVPEPATGALLATALVALGVLARRRTIH